MSLTPAAREHLLALADDEHIIGARHTNWIGLGPFLEEDLAFCSIAQDELGHAIGLYELLLDDAPLRARIGQAARQVAEQRYSWAQSVNSLDETLQEVVAHRHYDYSRIA